MTETQLPEGWQVTTQRTSRQHYDGHTIVRYAYVLHRPGWFPFVSGYRYNTEGSAFSSGMEDVWGTIALLACDECSGTGKVLLIPDQDDESTDVLVDCEKCDGTGISE